MTIGKVGAKDAFVDYSIEKEVISIDEKETT